MKTPVIVGALLLPVIVCAGCGDSKTLPLPLEVPKTVTGTMSFVLGGTAPVSGAARTNVGLRASSAQPPLVAGREYIVSPRKAKINFTSVTFRGATGETLGTSSFTGCSATYDRSLASGTTLLDCAFTAPVGDVYQIAVAYDNTIQLLVSDAETGIFTDPASTTGFSNAAPAGGANYVAYTLTIGNGTSRSTPIIFTTAFSITATSSPRLFVTTDMIHTLQLKVNAGGTTLSPTGSNDPVVLFGGPTRGSSRYYSDSGTIETIPVVGFHSVRIFYNEAGSPVYLIGPTPPACGVLDAPKGAWPTPPLGATIGGWLGRDSNGTIAWALPLTSSYATYSTYHVMQEQAAIGGSTTLRCKITTSPPPPADGKTYASGAPAMPSPDASAPLKLMAK